MPEYPMVLQEAQKMAAELDKKYPECAPHEIARCQPFSRKDRYHFAHLARG
jgi:hypothetical protein